MKPSKRSVLTEVKRREICAVLAMGGTRTLAARYVGCHVVTIRRLIHKDPDFATAVLQAESKHEILNLGHINKAAAEGRNWRAAAWVLERAYPDKYGKRRAGAITLDQLTDALTQVVDVLMDELDESELRERVLERLSRLSDELLAGPAEGSS